MTTPAKNEYAEVHLPANRLLSWAGVNFPVGNNLLRLHSEYRPASSTGGRIGNLKVCQDWEHSGSDWQKANDASVQYDSGDPTFWIRDSGNIFDDTFPSAIEPSSNMGNASLVKALEKLKNQDVHIGNFVAEAHKTLEMFATNANRIGKGVMAFRKKFPKLFNTARQVEKDSLPRNRWCEIPNLWLELQYGWKPLMSDVYGAIHHLQKRKRFNMPLVTVKGYVADDIDSYVDAFDTAGNKFSCHYTHHREVSTFLTYGLSSPGLAELSSLGLINPLEIVWETTRFSFVVDWFLPVSSWLSSLTADTGYTWKSGGQSIKSKCTFRNSTLVQKSPAYNIQNYSLPVRAGMSRSFRRHCFSGSPFPGLYVKNPLSLTHVANALSLLTQAFR